MKKSSLHHRFRIAGFLAVVAINSLFFQNCGMQGFGTLSQATDDLESVVPAAGGAPASSGASPIVGGGVPLTTPTPTATPGSLNSLAPTSADISLVGYSVTPTSLAAESVVSIRAVYQAKTAGSYNIDLEFRDNAGNTLQQNAATSQTFAAGESREFDWNYLIPGSATGAYWVCIAAFNSSWSTTYFWNQYAVAVSDAPPVATPKPLPSGGAVSGQFVLGVNADGMEYGGGSIPGLGGTNYALISSAEMDSYHKRGLNLIRLPTLWSRWQPTVMGDLNAAYVNQVKDVLALASARSMTVIIDVHNFGGRDGHQLNDGTLTSAQFADLWQKLAVTFKGVAGVAGYDLMNEPHDMPTQSAWPLAAQAAINSIRGVDTQVTLYVEGDGWSSAQAWNGNNVYFPLSDPSNKVIYSAHAYADRDNSGTHFVWADEASVGVTTDLLTTRIAAFASWCEAYRVPCHIGEVGVGNDDPSWNVALDKALTYAQAHGLQVTYWAAGPWWGSYGYSVESESATQNTVLLKYSGGQ